MNNKESVDRCVPRFQIALMVILTCSIALIACDTGQKMVGDVVGPSTPDVETPPPTDTPSPNVLRSEESVVVEVEYEGPEDEAPKVEGSEDEASKVEVIDTSSPAVSLPAAEPPPPLEDEN